MMNRRRRKRTQSQLISLERLEDKQLLTGLDFGDATIAIDQNLVPGPELTGLNVAGEGVEFYPAFSPDTLRYAINPSADTDGITISALAGDGDKIKINGRAVDSGIDRVLNDLGDGEMIEVEVSNDELGSRTYELYHLPADFPLDVTVNTPDAQQDGFIYMTARAAGSPNYYLMKVDSNGVPVFTRATENVNTDFKRHWNGQYSYAERTDDNHLELRTFDIVILDHEFNEIDRLQTVGEDMNQTDNHDFIIQPNGNYVLMAYNGRVTDDILYQDSVIQVVDAETKQEITRWSSETEIGRDEVVPDFDSRLPDYAHVNSVFEDANGDFIISLRWTSSIVKFDGETGETIWRLGGTASDFEIDDHWGGPCGQHTAQFLPNGNLIYYDNGTGCPDLPEYANRPEDGLMRYVEYELDQENMTATLVREIINEDLPTGPTGSVQVLPNGNRLVSWGLPGGDFGLYEMKEYDQDNNVVREFRLNAREEEYFSYRAQWREELNYPTLAADGGASHVIVDGFHLGSSVDADDDGQPSTISGDDVDVTGEFGGTNDEDGVVFTSNLVPGQLATVDVTASTNGLLNAWIDFNHDGDWTDAGEHVFADTQLGPGVNSLEFAVPADAALTSTFSRFRFSSQGGLEPGGPAPDGEVEDHRVEIEGLTDSSITDGRSRANFNFGGDVAIDGRYAAVAAPHNGHGKRGAVVIYERTGEGVNDWRKIIKIKAPEIEDDISGGDRFGWSIAMDNGTLVVGAPQAEDGEDDKTSGAVYVFEQNEGGENNWGQVQKLRASDAAKGDQFGRAVSIDGGIIAIGATLSDSEKKKNTGSLYVFERQDGEFVETHIVDDATANRDERFGWSVDVSGNNVIVSAPGTDAEIVGEDETITTVHDTGSVFVYQKRDGEWSQKSRIDNPNPNANATGADRFGNSVALHNETAVVGAVGVDLGTRTNAGAVYVLNKNEGGTSNWGISDRLTSSDAAEGDRFGHDVDVRGDRISVGARGKSSDAGQSEAGAVVLFERNDSAAWNEIRKFESGRQGSENLGSSVAMTSRYIFAGAPMRQRGQYENAGGVSVFHTAMAFGLRTEAMSFSGPHQVLTDAQLAPVVEAAKQQWVASGISTADAERLNEVRFFISDLTTNGQLGAATEQFVTLDSTAAGHGWFVDATPGILNDDLIGTRMDLLTVVAHELGHVLGFEDTYAPGDSNDLMHGILSPGERRTVSAAAEPTLDAVFSSVSAELPDLSAL